MSELKRWVSRRFRKKKLFLLRLLCALIACALHIFLYCSGTGLKLEDFAHETWYSIRGPLIPPAHNILVSIDEDTYSRLAIDPRRPLPRKFYADAVTRLKNLGAKQIFIDVNFRGENTEDDSDAILAAALKKTGAVIATFYMRSEVTSLDGTSKESVVDLTPAPIFVANAKVSSFALRLENGVAKQFNLAKNPETFAITFSSMFSPPLEIPTEHDYIKYYGPSGYMPRISFGELLHEKNEDLIKYFKDSIVVMGLTRQAGGSDSSKDTFVVPYEHKYMFGSEIFDTILANIAAKDWIRRAPLVVEVAVLNVVSFLLTFLLTTLAVRNSIKVYSGLVVIWAITAYVMFLGNVFLPGATLMLCVLPVSILCYVALSAKELNRTLSRLEGLIDKREQKF
jgi:CHASE2 domain-containing sensor protein